MGKHENILVQKVGIAGVIAISLMLLMSLIVWSRIPADQLIAIHWGINGQPDGFAPRQIALFILPLIMGLATLIFAVKLKTERFEENLYRSRHVALSALTGALLLIGVVHGLILLTALGFDVPITSVVSFGTGLLISIIGGMMAAGMTYRNTSVGVRTPWTLKCDDNWKSTNQLAGWMMLAMGLFIIIASAVNSMLLLLIGVLGGALALVAVTWSYSYFSHSLRS